METFLSSHSLLRQFNEKLQKLQKLPEIRIFNGKLHLHLAKILKREIMQPEGNSNHRFGHVSPTRHMR